MILFEQKTTDDIIDSECTALSRELDLSPAFCRLLVSRGITDADSARAFLDPVSVPFHDPFLFRDMDKAVERIERALDDDERICIFGDYDVDGICATSMLLMYLEYLGADVFYYIPSRHTEGYGMTPDGVKRVHERGAKLIITVDNGIVATGETALAKSLGMDVIITDHHRAGQSIPDCTAVICHSRPDNTYPDTNLCGAGVALKLIAAHGGDEAAQEFIPFAGFATVSDIVPLTGENRTIVARALDQLNSGDWPVGLRALADVSGIKERPLTAHDFGYKLGPRLNAAGRLEDASLGVELLCSDFAEDAILIAERLNVLNDERREYEAAIVDSARAMLDDMDIANVRVILLKSPDWNTGVLGIAASRIADEYYRPTVLFNETDGVLVGSARSIPGVDIHALLSQFSDMYERFGGHKMAAGLTLSAERFEELSSLLNKYALLNIPANTYIPRKSFDTELSFADIDLAFIESVERLAPFGEGNPTPAFVVRNARLTEMRIVGKTGEHLNGKAVSAKRTMPWVSFYRAREFNKLLSADAVDMLYSPTVNEWNGKQIQLQVRDFAVSCIDPGYIDRHAHVFSEAFLRNLLLREERTETPEHTTSDPESTMRELLRENFAGNMILCFTPEGARRALSVISEYGLHADISIGAPENPACAYNALVLAPVIDTLSASARHMNKVLVFDQAFDKETEAALLSALPDAQIMLSTKAACDDTAGEFTAAADRESMGALYREAMAKLRSAPCFLDDCAAHIAERTGKSNAFAEFALRVFSELEFIRLDANMRLFADLEYKKRPLTDSALYRRLMFK